jgi:hypothetical protein
MLPRFISHLILFVGLLFQNGYSSQITDQIRIRLESDQPGEKIEIRGASLKSIDEIQRFYVNRNFEEIWSKNGILTELAYEMRFEISQSQFDGLNPKNYNIELVELFFLTFESNKKSRIVNSLGDVADLDLLLSNAFFYLSRHLELGKIDPASLKSHWEITSKSKKADYSSLLTEGYNTRDIRRQLEKLYPDFTM